MQPQTRIPAPAWGVPSRGEPRWPASLAVVATLLLYVTLPEQLTVGPTWALPVLTAALLVPLSIAAPHRRPNEPRWQAVTAVVLIAVINLANIGSLILLVDELTHGSKASGQQLLIDSAKIWLTNILVFALWYWELDRGGPDERGLPDHREPDFLFPQMTTEGCSVPHWTPSFVDYCYVAFTNATAFSPTDTMPLTAWAKLLMMVQASTSLLTVVLVAARAVNILS
jgi:hypothetical protein